MKLFAKIDFLLSTKCKPSVDKQGFETFVLLI